MRFIVALLLFCLSLSLSFAQEGQRVPLRKHSFYFDLMGFSGGLYSSGYERLLYQHKKLSWYARVGTTHVPVRFVFNGGMLSLGAHMESGILWGGKRHKLELGAGFAYQYYYFRNFEFRSPRKRCCTDSYKIPTRIGYRYISKSGLLYYHFAFHPYLFLDHKQPGDEYTNSLLVLTLGLGIGIQL